MSEVLVLMIAAALAPLLIFPVVRFAAKGKRGKQQQLLLKLLSLGATSLAAALAVYCFGLIGIKGNGVMIIMILYVYGVYVLAKQIYTEKYGN
jgi:hypothetical protein